MRLRSFVYLAVLSAAMSACGGRSSSDHGGAAGTGVDPVAGNSSAGGPGAGSNAGGSGGNGTAGRGVGGSAAGAEMGGAATGGAEMGGGGTASCTGSLLSVSALTGFACPSTLCSAEAWSSASCALWSSVSAAEMLSCAELHALRLTLVGGETQTCIYSNRASGPGQAHLDGALVGAMVRAKDPRFCGGTADEISAGQRLPGDCVVPDLGTGCTRSSALMAGATPSDDDAPAPVACANAFSSSCEPCCPAVKPECTDKPDSYPGYGCTPSANEQGGPSSFCTCTCSGGEWLCAC